MPKQRSPSANDSAAGLRLARAVRDACLAAAREASEDAGVRGLCAEGALEAALGAIQSLDLDALLSAEARAPRLQAGPHAPERGSRSRSRRKGTPPASR